MDGSGAVKRALLLSGGMDSTALAWWQRPQIAITINYGQRAAAAELRAARTVASRLGIDWHPVTLDARALGSGDMAGTPADPLAPASDWWPYRNQLLVTIAGMQAVRLGVGELMLGTVATDSQHADGQPAFVAGIDALMRVQEGALRVKAPAIELTTVELVLKSQIPRDLLAWAHSCHKADVACGQCRGCNKYFETWQVLDGRPAT